MGKEANVYKKLTGIDPVKDIQPPLKPKQIAAEIRRLRHQNSSSQEPNCVETKSNIPEIPEEVWDIVTESYRYIFLQVKDGVEQISNCTQVIRASRFGYLSLESAFINSIFDPEEYPHIITMLQKDDWEPLKRNEIG